MSLREQILFQVNGDINKINAKEEKEKGLNSFLEAFAIDAKEYGLEEATRMYGIIYGKPVEESLIELKEDFEGVLNEYVPRGTGMSEPADVRKAIGGIVGSDAGRGTAGLADVANNYMNKSGLVAGSGASSAPAALGLWDKIKNFFTGGFEPIKKMFETGNFSGLLSNPLFQGALAVGGAAVVIKILKKIFGKKWDPSKERETQAKIQAQIDAKKAQRK